MRFFQHDVFFKRSWAGCLAAFAGVLVWLASCNAQAAAKSQRPCGVLIMEGQSKTVLVVEKKTQTLFIHTIDGDGVKTRKAACSTGKEPGDKKMADDSRTPEGVYFFDARLTGRKVPKGFGNLAYRLDYPSSVDTGISGKIKPLLFYGSSRALKPMDTSGGIAVEKTVIQELQEDIVLEDTAMIIVEDKGDCLNEINEGLVKDLDRFLAVWVKSLSEGTYHEMLGHYSSDSMPDMGWWNEWRTNRANARQIGVSLACAVSERSYYTDSDLYVALFRLTLVAGETSRDLGMRKLFIRQEKDGYRIVGDETRKTEKGASVPLASASRTLCKAAEVERKDSARQDIPGLLEGWKAAWASGDMDSYASYYSESFKSSGLNKKAWVEKKRKLGNVNRNIEITIEKPQVQFRKNKTLVRFREIFKSSGYSSRGMKTLVLVREGEDWKIQSEDWVKK